MALRQALKGRDASLLNAAMVMALLTLVTNKPYLGWPRHEWDAMFLGVLLVGAVIIVRRWLAGGHNGVRRGFTAQRLSGSDKRFLSVLGSASGLVPGGHGPAPGTGAARPDFGGGRSGGGGASANY